MRFLIVDDNENTSFLDFDLDDLINQVQNLNLYINELNTKIKWDSNSTKLLFNDNKYIEVNNSNAYKFVANSIEPLASDTWVQNQLTNYYSKSDLTNWSVDLNIRSLKIGNNNKYFNFWVYNNNEACISFVNYLKVSFIAPNDSRITWFGSSWVI